MMILHHAMLISLIQTESQKEICDVFKKENEMEISNDYEILTESCNIQVNNVNMQIKL